MQSLLSLSNVESEVFDLKYIMANADSVSYGIYTIIGMIESLDSINIEAIACRIILSYFFIITLLCLC